MKDLEEHEFPDADETGDTPDTPDTPEFESAEDAFAHVEKPRKDRRSGPRTEAQKAALKKAQEARARKFQEKQASKPIPIPGAAAPMPEEPPPEMEIGSPPRVRKRQPATGKKRTTRIILEESSSDSEGPELVIRRGNRKAKAKARAPQSPQSPPSPEPEPPPHAPVERTPSPVPQRQYTNQEILRAFGF